MKDKAYFYMPFGIASNFFLAYPHQKEKLAILVSLSKDGELIAETIKRFGLATIRGSSSRRGTGALAEIISKLEEGFRVAITPDGPKGPSGTVHGGIIAAALKTNLPIIPVAYAAKRKMTFNSWDRYMVPLPFNKIGLIHGKPLYLNQEQSFDTHCAQLRQSLDSVYAEAESLL